MKSILRPLFAAAACSLALFVTSGHAAGPTPESRADRLDALVKLTAQQKAMALEIFQRESADLDALKTPEALAKMGGDARVASRARVWALLTPEQRKKYAVSPQVIGGGLMTNPEFLVERLDQVVRLTADQKKKATQIIWDDFMDQMAALPPDEAPKGFAWRQGVRDRLRAILTPDQQAKFDVTSPYRTAGK